MNRQTRVAMLEALLAAVLFGISAPFAKLLLVQISPLLLAAFLYLGAGMGMLLLNLCQSRGRKEANLSKQEWPFIVSMIVLDIAAPVLLLFGLDQSSSATVALLSNFEIVATSLLAFCFFHEALGRRIGIVIGLITLASMILSIEPGKGFTFSLGAIFVLVACVCWGLENNCTRMLSLKDPMQVVIIKGLGSGIGALLLALVCQQTGGGWQYFLLAMILGFFSYGLSIYFYVKAQRELGAARTSAYYAISPFIGVIISVVLFQENLPLSFFIALTMMLLATYLAAVESHEHWHVHDSVQHDHAHSHKDGHHAHHSGLLDEKHSHQHDHEAMAHQHEHTPNLHHKHKHMQTEKQEEND